MKELANIFATNGFLPQGYCFAWTPEWVWTYAAADTLIGLAYYSIPLALLYFSARRHDLPYRWMFYLFAGFLFACGTTQFLHAATLWQPVYWLDAGAKIATAALSIGAAVLLWRIVPRAMALPGQHELELANLQLEREVASLRHTEQGVLRVSEERFRELADTLERRIADRTAGFEAANVLLQWEIEERHRAEAQLQQANALLKEALAGQARHTAVLAQLNQLSTFMQSCRSEVEAYAVVARFAPNLFNAPSGAVFALNAARGVVEAAAVWGDMPADEQTFAPGECWALRRTRLYPENETEAVISCPHMRSEGARRHACVPLSPNGEPLGLLHLRGRPIPLDANERALVTTVSERIAVTVASIKLRENLVRQSLRDALTGLFNRRYLEEFLALEERRGLRTGASIGMVMIDLDRFKAVNDTYGHDAGDEVLRRVAAVLQEHTRSGDIPCRYGGEEFLLVLPGASLEVTRERAEQLRARLAAQRIIFRGNPIGTVTASLGVAAFPTSGTPIAGALAAADRALYLAKQNGRDRVECEGYREVA